MLGIFTASLVILLVVLIMSKITGKEEGKLIQSGVLHKKDLRAYAQ